MLSVVIPVYRNEEFVSSLIAEFERITTMSQERFGEPVEFVFVVDGSPDASHPRLAKALPSSALTSQLIEHSRNFGAFAAMRTGLAAGSGDYFAVIAADLQEPPELLLDFLDLLRRDEADVVVGRRTSRNDPLATRWSANLFWGIYRRLIIPEVPPGGVDVFGCTLTFRNELLRLSESHSSLIGQLFWIGFRRAEVPYDRRVRVHGKSAWTWGKKLRYMSDSIFAFTDLPIRLLLILGMFGVSVALVLGASVLMARMAGMIDVPGYSATIIVVVFFGALNIFGLGLVGSYAARGYENSKGRPLAVVRRAIRFSPETADRDLRP
jgi:glycosyltransferase involved in cell wall biosynthesis